MILNTKKIFILISVIVLATICLQIYWNFKNYSTNKERLKNEVQIAYDNSLEIYFDKGSKENFISIFSTDSTLKTTEFFNKIKTDSIFEKEIKQTKNIVKKSKINFKASKTKDSIKAEAIEIKSINVLKGKKAFDSINVIENFPNRITMSFINDTINYKTLDSIFNVELKRKNIALKYEFQHLKKDTLFYNYSKSNEKLLFEIKPNSAYFKSNDTINLNYNYSNELVLKRIGNEIILSLLFSFAVIGCLFFLLFIIKKQKKVDEIKNDFINNITHEFKTPITTIATALEGMSTFNPENDPVKNQKYIAMSFNQLHKLENMVEKILETATLNAKELQLNLEEINLVPFIKSISEKHLAITNKAIDCIFENDEIFFYGDTFYLENAISNVIDNAIKYGGNKIQINCFTIDKCITIDIKDDGNSISKSEEKNIFEKFYRIPKGNIHDIKGYGIGLYYAKSIIEKHNGTLILILNNETTFRIQLPNEH